MKELKLEKYVVRPNVGFYGGYVYDGEDIDLCDDHDTDESYDFKVKQKIRDGILYTEIESKVNKVKEHSFLEVELKKGDLLVYVDGVGFTIPEYKMCTVDKAMELYDIIK